MWYKLHQNCISKCAPLYCCPLERISVHCYQTPHLMWSVLKGRIKMGCVLGSKIPEISVFGKQISVSDVFSV